MIENWIDQIAKLAGEVKDERNRPITSYRVFVKNEFPGALSVFPCALTYPTQLITEYADAGCIDRWEGKTEFYLTPDDGRQYIPEVIRYFARVRNAFAMHRSLGGKVAYCVLRTDQASIQGPVLLQYGDEINHWGLVANWIVKEISSLTLGL